MKKVQRFMGVGDSKPASAPLSVSPGKSFLNVGVNSTTLASTQSADGAAASLSYDSTSSRLLPPSQSAQPAQLSPQQSRPGSRQVSPQTSQSLLRPSLASPQPKSPTAQQQYFDLPINGASPNGAASPRPLSPLALPVLNHAASTSTLNPTSNSVDVSLVERADLHKSLKAVESLLVNLDEYRDLSARLAKVERKLAKSASELERTKVVLETPSQTLQLTSTMFEGLAEVSSRHAKHVQREYEAVNDACAKYFKKVAKEERAHDELIHTLDAKIKKANAAHEKNVKKASPNKALESHDKYVATVQSLTNDMGRAKNTHALSMAAKSHVSSLLVASTVGGLADVEFKHRCESVRRIGPHVGKLNELLCFTSSEFMPALQAAESTQVEQGQAEYLASLTAQVEASVAVQAQINAKINEDTQIILRAQEMGWRPPSPSAPLAVDDAADLGRSTSINSNVSRGSETSPNHRPPLQHALSKSKLAEGSTANSTIVASTLPRTSSLRLQPQRETGRTLHQPSAMTGPTSSPPPVEMGAASLRSVATDQTARPDNGTAGQSSSLPPSNQSSILLNPPSATASLVRAPTDLTIKSMAAQPQLWETTSPSLSSSAISASSIQPSNADRLANNALQVHDRDGNNSSATEGSIIDKLSVPREDSDAVAPSLSATNSAQGSEDGNRIPRTPDDSEGILLMQQQKPQIPKGHHNASPIVSAAEPGRAGVVTSPKVRPAQRALEQYREHTTKVETSPTANFAQDSASMYNVASGLGQSDSLYDAQSQRNAAAAAAAAALDQANARKISLWERERERMRQLEREDELAAARTPMSATVELGYQRPASAIYSNPPTSSTFNNNGGWSRSRISDSGVNDKSASSQLGLGYPRASGADVRDHDLDRYAPAVGSTRLSAVSVTRSLSTDTTASERSFVARMKARYQAEKDIEREQRELNVLEKERAARRVTMDPTLSLPSMTGARGRVPEIASRYQMSGAGTYAQEVSSGRRYHDSLPANAHSGGSGGGSRINDISSSPSAAIFSGNVDEFGGIIRDSRMLPSGRRSMEPPHSDVCGCHQCSGRHYGSGTTRMDDMDRQEAPPAAVSARSNPREYNVRRTTMPVLSREEQYAKQQAYPSSPPRASPREAYAQEGYSYRGQQQQQLQMPGGRDAGLPRRSYEGLGPSSDIGSRRVVFAHEPQTIR
ncbi:hypothetical protein PHSY_001895 [Pseudozyma hubeiensis SY62]|uniref:Uncharacterized protein n=1 Tax=Pseudozyma hubeiensis (strain SY62) TaxID=1305764 RepID=R9NZW6_PSEHS|nr:hypothetical protein PHSY_001895 [Pseudozyma hubeiensis SY62]GAC94324.1 hypothetical protein PHSY_001895 [Pseudozyma hubeiensis SY62]